MRLLILQSINDSLSETVTQISSVLTKHTHTHTHTHKLMQISCKTKTFVGKILWNSVYHMSQQSMPGQISDETEIKTSWDICIPMFTAALFTITKIWKQPKCPLTDEWIKKIWHPYPVKNYSAMKEQNGAICRGVDGPRDCHTEWG